MVSKQAKGEVVVRGTFGSEETYIKGLSIISQRKKETMGSKCYSTDRGWVGQKKTWDLSGEFRVSEGGAHVGGKFVAFA